MCNHGACIERGWLELSHRHLHLWKARLPNNQCSVGKTWGHNLIGFHMLTVTARYGKNVVSDVRVY